jgi:hypothetical protein
LSRDAAMFSNSTNSGEKWRQCCPLFRSYATGRRTMTTKSDWEFRASYLDAAARRLDRKAVEKLNEAQRLRRLAQRAHSIAVERA